MTTQQTNVDWSRPIEAVHEDRFWSKVDKTAGSQGCWLWKAGLFASGYGSFSMKVEKKQNLRAHRVSYLIAHGTIPNGLYIDHMCRNRRCVNPAHLRAVTPRVNALENSDCVSATNVAKTHCVRGHAYDAANTLLIHNGKSKGRRYCKTCTRLDRARRRNEKKGLAA